MMMMMNKVFRDRYKVTTLLVSARKINNKN